MIDIDRNVGNIYKNTNKHEIIEGNKKSPLKKITCLILVCNKILILYLTKINNYFFNQLLFQVLQIEKGRLCTSFKRYN